MAGYFTNIAEGVKSTLKGMGLTFRHALNARRRRKASDIQRNDFFEVTTGMVTVQYPQETVPIPDHGRYRLHNEMDDCIVCDKCAKVCPVDCIEIEPIKATEEVGRASDGSVIRLYAAKFDIDMAKCCYCGLCTTVCPTESLTMTKTFDYSEFDVREMVYAYSNLTPEQAQEKRELLEQFQLEKAQGKAKTPAAAPATGKSTFRPVMKPRPASPAATESPIERPVAKPTRKFHPGEWSANSLENMYRPGFSRPQPLAGKAKDAKPAFKPSLKPQPVKTPAAQHTGNSPKPAFRPTMKPQGAKVPEQPKAEATPKPAFRPTMKPQGAKAPEQPKAEATPKPAFRPTIKPQGAKAPEQQPKAEATPKPAFRPTIKPQGTKAPGQPAAEKMPKPAFRPTRKAQSPSDAAQAPKPVFKPAGLLEPNPVEVPKGDNIRQPVFRPTRKLQTFSTNPAQAPRPTFRPANIRDITTGSPDTGDHLIKPAFRPTRKPKPPVSQGSRPVFNPILPTEGSTPESKKAPASEEAENTKKPAFRPTMKPKK